MNDVETTDFEIYPNPVSRNVLNVSVNDPNQIENFMIINGSRQILIIERLTSINNSIDISDLNAGIYIVKNTYKNNSNKVEKLMVKLVFVKLFIFEQVGK